MPFERVASLVNLPPGAMLEVDRGEDRIALCNVAGQVFAIDGICPHSSGPLAQGALHGSTVVCPWHAWEFDCVTGACDRSSLTQRTYPVKIENGGIFLESDGARTP